MDGVALGHLRLPLLRSCPYCVVMATCCSENIRFSGIQLSPCLYRVWVGSPSISWVGSAVLLLDPLPGHPKEKLRQDFSHLQVAV